MGQHRPTQHLNPRSGAFMLWGLVCLAVGGACSLTFDDHALPRAGCVEGGTCVETGDADAEGGSDADAGNDDTLDDGQESDNAVEDHNNNSVEDNNDPPGCAKDEDCEVGPCRTATCMDGRCTLALAVAVACDDGDLCTRGDRCDDQGRCSGEPLRCEPAESTCDADNRVYTTFLARCEEGQCVQVPSTLECPECRERCLETCSDFQCAEPEPCLTTRCDPGVDGPQCLVESLPDDSRCTFSGVDESAAGWCRSGSCIQCRGDADCDDNDPCTQERCEEGFCSSLPADGLPCQGGVCAGGACVECVTPSDCSGSALGCRVPTCVQHQCVSEVKPDGAQCVRSATLDGYCLRGSCVVCASDEHCAQSPMGPWCEEGRCSECDHRRPDTCSDGDPCTNDVCSNGFCFFNFDRTHEGEACTRLDDQMREIPGRCNQSGRCE